MFKHLTLTLCLLCGLCVSLFSQQDGVIDDPGDVMIVGFSFVGTDGFSFLAMDNIPNGQSIMFTDEEASGGSFPGTNFEGEVTWTNNTGGVVAAGTVIDITSASSSPVASIGTATESDLGFSLASLDELYAYTGSYSSPTFITFFTAKNSSFSSLISGTGLVSGTTAFFLDAGTNFPGYGSSTDNLAYTGSTVCNGTLTACQQQIYNVSNWGDDATTFPTSVPNAFTGTLFATGCSAPVASCQNATVQLDAAGNASLTPPNVDNGSSADSGCTIAATSVSPSSFNCADVGSNTVTLTVTDSEGNSSTCTATVTIEDNVAPTITCPGNQSRLVDANCNYVLEDLTGLVSTSDNCSTVSVSQNPVVGFTPGTTGAIPMTMTATDGSGNSVSM